VHGESEYSWVILKDEGGTVSLMDIEVEDENFLSKSLLLQNTRCDR